eukprot:s1000_g2.t1
MLRILSLSGSVVTALDSEEIGKLEGASFVSALKHRLRPLLGVSRFRQRLLCGELTASETASYEDLGSPRELHVVVLPYSKDKVLELRSASARGAFEEVQQLLELPQDPNAARADDRSAGSASRLSRDLALTPLQCAADCGQLQVVQLLLEASAEPDRGCPSPLGFAAAHGHAEVAQCLLEAKACKEKADSSDRSPVFMAAIHGHFDVMQLLVEARASVNSISENGHSPLSAVCAMGREKMVRSLLELRADPAIPWTPAGEVSLVSAVRGGHVAVVSALLDAAADPCSAVPGQPCLADSTLSRRHEDVAQLLFEARAAEERTAKRRRRDGQPSDANPSSAPEEDSKKKALEDTVVSCTVVPYHIKPQGRRSSPIPDGESGQAEHQALDPTSTYGDLISESCAERCTESCVRLRCLSRRESRVFKGYVGTTTVLEKTDPGLQV